MYQILILLISIQLNGLQNAKQYADIVSVEVSGSENNYNFSVGISSPDRGCEQYANWWEVVSLDGALIYRRILGHSHVNEQPFVRSGGQVEISTDQVVLIRGHMNNAGYGGLMFKGSVEKGFKQVDADNTFALDLETTAPLPKGCAF